MIFFYTFFKGTVFSGIESPQALVSPHKFLICAGISQIYSQISIHFPGIETQKVRKGSLDDPMFFVNKKSLINHGWFLFIFTVLTILKNSNICRSNHFPGFGKVFTFWVFWFSQKSPRNRAQTCPIFTFCALQATRKVFTFQFGKRGKRSFSRVSKPGKWTHFLK